MSRRMFPLLAVAAAVIAAGPVAAQNTDQNVRCLLASNVFASQEKDPGRKQVAVSSAFFYLGRLNTNTNAAQLKAQIVAQGKTLNPQTAGPIMTACAQEVGAKQKLMEGIGKELQAAAPKK